MPDYESFIPDGADPSSWTVNSWNRPTIGWSLACEESGDTRQVGMQAMATPSIVTEVQTLKLFRLGVTVVSIFCIYFFVAMLIHFCAFKSLEPNKISEYLIYMMYVPSRLSFIVWGPWIANLAEPALEQVSEGQGLVD